MASLNMGISYDLTYDVIDKIVVSGRIGNYAYGYLDNRGVFIVRYVGRCDSDLRERIKHGVREMQTDPTLRYERFKFSYADSPIEAYEKECKNYHDFGGEDGLLQNIVHPSKPKGYTGVCAICGR